MRTIKFRGYNPKNQKWIYGYYFVNRHQHFIVSDELAPPTNTWEDYEVLPETIGQYIGRNDKNGTEIYEGDIVRAKYSSIEEGKIVSEEQPVVWDIMSSLFTVISLYGDELDFEVIGNIHERKE